VIVLVSKLIVINATIYYTMVAAEIEVKEAKEVKSKK